MTYLPPGGKYSLICEPIDYSGSHESMKLVRLGWWLLLLKIAEFADTVIVSQIFFGCNCHPCDSVKTLKNTDQISTLYMID
jgi:hypothetical protein